ncbi:hypothetical protein NLX83_13760 [Allokutzneria sp. A3M-2-11 16]|uniref:hypothetical protein n=1 Tax=Allokutzneria sp. A3M-2-11 16 TaxID=2962043 RepID=UPI0020B6FBC8|nr:hypothetical protein [Allokutzneria sp. A3M-2-11 16]MCP3800325.1 hypothetical protein [Allokutzneria sp. A3M-2-11 16]
MTSPPAPLASVADVLARTDQEFNDAERARIAVLCADATAIARSRVPTMPSPPPPTAVGVVAAAVLRAMDTPPENVRAEAVGGHSRTLAHEGGGLYFTDAELDLLKPVSATSNRGAWSIWTV